MAKPASFLPHRVLTRSSLAIATALVVVLSSMQFSAVAAVDSSPKVILDVENTSQSTYVTNRIRDMIEVGDKLFFVRDHASDDYGTAELWVSDGTEAGTKFLVQIQHYDDKNDTSDHFAAVGELLYFFQPFETTSDVIRYELWTSNGTELGTVKVTDIVPDIGIGGYFDPRRLKATSSRLFFRNNEGDNEHWTSDGTQAGTSRVRDVTTLDRTAVLGDTLFFSGGATDDMLWKTTDGTSATTVQVTTTDPGGGDGIRDLEALGDWVYFSFAEANGDMDLWRSNGTPGPGQRLTTEDLGPRYLTRVEDLLYFVEGSIKLWSTNGTLEDDETLRKELIIDSQTRGIGNFEELTAVGDSLFFTGEETLTGEYNAELWFSGGSSDTSSLVYSETTAGNDILDFGLAAVGDKIFFTTGEGESLFSSDGTTTAEVVVDNQDDNMYELTSAGGILYFVSYDSSWQQPRLWSFNLNSPAPTGGGSYSAPVLPLASLQTKVVRFQDFTSNSSFLSKKARAGLTKAIKKLTVVNSVVCTGYTSGVRATASQRKLALDRARLACNVARKLAPDAVVKLQADPARGTGAKYRAVRVKITGN
jgi:ELWxxDGT repeat protein